MKLGKKICISAAILVAVSGHASATNNNDVNAAIENGLRYLESVQSEYGEFPTTFTPNISEDKRALYSAYDSNLFTTAMIADALHSIKSPRVDRMENKVVTYLKSQLNNDKGLWSYFTTHNPKPLYPNTIYDMDDTVFASMVLKHNSASYPDNRTIIKANKDQEGLYKTWLRPDSDIDCGVNANVLSYLQENDSKVCDYLNEQVIQGKTCAWYYTRMDSYYLISRAYASGVSCLKPSVSYLTSYTLSTINREGSVENSPYKTAVALNILLAVNYQGPEIQRAKEYLLKTQSPHTGAWPAEDFWLWPVGDENGNPKIIGRSGSSAITTAFVIKALNALK
jgi:hypothetical protein